MFPEGRFFELLMVGALALIVVGPKDLPILMRKVGQFVGKMRGMAAEFRSSFDELARQSELEELRREVEAMRYGQPTALTPATASPAQSLEMRPLTQDHPSPAPPPAAPAAAEAAAELFSPDAQPGLFDDHEPDPARAPQSEPAPVLPAVKAASDPS